MPTSTKNQPVLYSKKLLSWNSKCTSKNWLTNYAAKTNSINSPMSPSTNCFVSNSSKKTVWIQYLWVWNPTFTNHCRRCTRCAWNTVKPHSHLWHLSLITFLFFKFQPQTLKTTSIQNWFWWKFMSFMDNQFRALILVGGYCYERTLLLCARHVLYFIYLILVRYLFHPCCIAGNLYNNYLCCSYIVSSLLLK